MEIHIPTIIMSQGLPEDIINNPQIIAWIRQQVATLTRNYIGQPLLATDEQIKWVLKRNVVDRFPRIEMTQLVDQSAGQIFQAFAEKYNWIMTYAEQNKGSVTTVGKTKIQPTRRKFRANIG